MASEKRVQAVFMVPDHSGTYGVNDSKFCVGMGEADFPEHQLDQREWTLSTFSEKIGLPLKMGSLGESPKGENRAGRLLSVEAHPDQNSFGGTHTKYERELLVVARCDGANLEPPLLYVVLGFIQHFKKSADPLVGKTDEESYAAKKKLAATVNPEHFKNFFESSGKQEAAQIYPSYIDAKLPDAAQGKFCRKCGMAEEEGKTKLLGCGGCNEVYYCDKKCQKLNWKAHKEICKGQKK